MTLWIDERALNADVSSAIHLDRPLLLQQSPTAGASIDGGPTLNVTVIVIEQLEWGGALRTVTYAPSDGADLWVARLDEYEDARSGPFHVLDPGHERQVARGLRRSRSRTTAGYTHVGGDLMQFKTEWLGIATNRSGLSCYALALPTDAVPERISFTDPHSPDREYRYRAVLDRPRSRVVCYLECRSRLGSFDFDLLVTFRRDSAGCGHFAAHEGGKVTPDFQDLTRMAGFRSDERVIQQFFDSSTAINAGSQSIVVSQANVDGPIIGGVSGVVGAIGTSATGEISLDLADVLSTHRAQVRAELQQLLDAARGDALMQADLAAAVSAVEADDANEASSALRRVGTRGLQLARDLGVNLVAAVIAAQLGIGT